MWPHKYFSWLLLSFAFSAGACILVSPSMSWLPVVVFILSGWLLGLSLHEYGHAVIANSYDRRTLVDESALKLDLLTYLKANPHSAMTLIAFALGGIPLPGGAVRIVEFYLPSPLSRTLVSLSGPIMTALFAVVCIVASRIATLSGHDVLAMATAGLAYFKVCALILNLMPIPGLDGYAAIEPHLPNKIRRSMDTLFNHTWREVAFVVITLLVGWLIVSKVGYLITSYFGIDPGVIYSALSDMRLSSILQHLIL